MRSKILLSIMILKTSFQSALCCYCFLNLKKRRICSLAFISNKSIDTNSKKNLFSYYLKSPNHIIFQTSLIKLSGCGVAYGNMCGSLMKNLCFSLILILFSELQRRFFEVVGGAHKRTAYTAFWTKAPPGRKKNIPKGTASNG